MSDAFILAKTVTYVSSLPVTYVTTLYTLAARSVGRGTHSVLTVKLKRSEPFGRPPLQWHMDCCKLQFQDVFWSRGPKDVGLLPSVRDALSAATRRQIPISHVAYTLVALYHFRVQLSIGQTFNEMVK